MSRDSNGERKPADCRDYYAPPASRQPAWRPAAPAPAPAVRKKRRISPALLFTGGLLLLLLLLASGACGVLADPHFWPLLAGPMVVFVCGIGSFFPRRLGSKPPSAKKD